MEAKVIYLGDITWSCSSDKIQVSPEGIITPLEIGKYKIKFNYTGSKSGSITKTISILPKKPSIKKVTVKKTSAKVYIKKVSNVSGYQIRYYWRDSYWSLKSKTVTVSKVASSKTIKKLSRKTYYDFRIRSYKKVGGKKYYSEWSDVKSKKTK